MSKMIVFRCILGTAVLFCISRSFLISVPFSKSPSIVNRKGFGSLEFGINIRAVNHAGYVTIHLTSFLFFLLVIAFQLFSSLISSVVFVKRLKCNRGNGIFLDSLLGPGTDMMC